MANFFLADSMVGSLQTYKPDQLAGNPVPKTAWTKKSKNDCIVLAILQERTEKKKHETSWQLLDVDGIEVEWSNRYIDHESTANPARTTHT